MADPSLSPVAVISALVPRVVDQTESARDAETPSTRAPTAISRQEYLALHPATVRPFLERIIDKAEADPGWKVTWSTQTPAMKIKHPDGARDMALVYGYALRSGSRLTICGGPTLGPHRVAHVGSQVSHWRLRLGDGAGFLRRYCGYLLRQRSDLARFSH